MIASESPRTATSQKTIEQAVAEFSRYAEQIPGVVIIHNIRDLSVVYMSKSGQEVLGVSLEELKEMGPRWHDVFFNPVESKDYVPKIIGLLERNNNREFISLFQQVKNIKTDDWQWYHTSMRIFLWDEDDQPLLTMGIATPIDPAHEITFKVARLLEENNFLRHNSEKFQKLSKRQKEIIKLIAEGNTSEEIANKLFISAATVDTHRRNIRQILKINSTHGFIDYARAFNLI